MWPSDDRISYAKTKSILIIHGSEDDLIAVQMVRRLKSKAIGSKLVIIPGLGVGEIDSHPDYIYEINNFIA